MVQTEVYVRKGGSIAGLLLAPLRTIGAALLLLAQSGSMMSQINELTGTSDEELAARGLTRQGEIQRIFGARLYI